MSLGVGLYVKNSPEAVALYKDAFGLELGYHVLNSDGTFFHSELMRDGDEFVAVVEAEKAATDCPVQLGVEFKERCELEKALELLRAGGKVKMEICELPWSPCAAEVVDKFGVDWYLTLRQHRPDDSFTPEDMK